jgi:hypothetical protein
MEDEVNAQPQRDKPSAEEGLRQATTAQSGVAEPA